MFRGILGAGIAEVKGGNRGRSPAPNQRRCGRALTRGEKALPRLIVVIVVVPIIIVVAIPIATVVTIPITIVIVMMIIMVPIRDDDEVQIVDEAAKLLKRRRVHGDGTGTGLKDAGQKCDRHG
jgi:hypothetical protein